VATILVGTWTSSVDAERLNSVLDGDLPFDERTMIDDAEEDSVEPKAHPQASAGH
jgi:aerobic C4-dicarboxylate transport protein